MNEFVEQFLIESRELVGQAIDDLLALEENPSDRERLDSAFRAFHTLKGAAGIVDFAAMARTLHAAEDILAAIRSSEDLIATNVLEECLACLDLTSRWLDEMQTSGEAPTNAGSEADDMIARLVGAPDADERENTPLPGNEGWLERAREVAGQHFDGPRTAVRYVPDPEAFLQGSDPMAIVAALPQLLKIEIALTNSAVSLDSMDTFSCGIEIIALLGAPAVDVRAALTSVPGRTEIHELSPLIVTQAENDFQSKAISLLEAQLLLLRGAGVGGIPSHVASAGRTAVNALVVLGKSEPAKNVERATARAQAEHSAIPLIKAIEQALAVGGPNNREEQDASSQIQAPRALRVDMNRIDALVKLTGELVVLKNAIGHAARLSSENKESALSATLREQHTLFDRLATELQAAVLRIRVLPLRTVFRRFPRLVREISGTVGKTVRLVTEGEGTEADTAIVDALFEPLLHILRNAVDHGIESPERRAAAGKPAMGTVILRGRRDADSVVIEVEDDGGGIDLTRVRSIAAERGIAELAVLEAMTDNEAADLIFAPGFSTAAAVTDLSGRGIGMNAVRTAVERLGGRVEVQTQSGAGTTIALYMPFSLMVTRVMTVEVAGQVFGLLSIPS